MVMKMYSMFLMRALLMLVLIGMFTSLTNASDQDTKEICERDSKKGIEQMRSKYKDNIEKWKALHDRACQAKVSVEDANKGLETCIHDRFVKMEEGAFKTAYLAAYEKCIKKIAPFKEICDSAEQKERVYCFMVEGRSKFQELCPLYVDDQEKQRALFRAAFECLDEKLKEKNV